MKSRFLPISPIYNNGVVDEKYSGLTKLELISAMALQGVIANPAYHSFQPDEFAKFAIKCADELLNQLEKTNEKSI